MENREVVKEEIQVDDVLRWLSQQVTPTTKVVLPFSGGLDSSVVVGLLVKTIGAENIVAINVSHDTSSSAEQNNARQVASLLGIHMQSVDLHDIADLYRLRTRRVASNFVDQQLPLAVTTDASLVYSFIQNVARSIPGDVRVAGTLDLTEKMLGYYPKGSFYGDFSPIGGFTRQEVRGLARQLNLPILPESHAVVDGCGDIVVYANQMIPKVTGQSWTVRNESELDRSVLQVLDNPTIDNPLARFSQRMSHKSIGSISSSPAYFMPERRKMISNWVSRFKGN